jgi:hypothetical protein
MVVVGIDFMDLHLIPGLGEWYIDCVPLVPADNAVHGCMRRGLFKSIFNRIIRLVQVRSEKSGISAGVPVIRNLSLIRRR